MNKRLLRLFNEAGFHQPEMERLGIEDKFEKFTELIVRECMAINKVETIALDLPDYNLGVIEGYRRARENISIHFGVEE